MSFIWTDGIKIGKPINILQRLMGAQDIYGNVKTLQYLHDVRVWAEQNSSTAKKLLKTIDDSDITIYLVGMDGGTTCFDSDPTPAGTVYINLNLKISFKPGGTTGGHSGFQLLHPYVAFLHEVGHAVQYIENPSQFTNSRKGPMYGLKFEIEEAAKKYGERVHPTVRYADRKIWFNQGPLIGTSWPVRLEYDNMFRHERPICLESGQPLRDYYNDARLD